MHESFTQATVEGKVLYWLVSLKNKKRKDGKGESTGLFLLCLFAVAALAVHLSSAMPYI
jgi:hypothetical protein